MFKIWNSFIASFFFLQAIRQVVKIDKLIDEAHIIHDMFLWVQLVYFPDGWFNTQCQWSPISARLLRQHWQPYGTFLRLPLPLRPTNRKSLKRATWFFITAVALRSSAAKFSSLPAAIVTRTPSGISPSATTLKATGRVLLHLQCDGNTLQTKFGESVLTSSPGYSASASISDRSPLIFRGPAFSETVVMVVQCVNHKSEPREYVWRVWHTTGRWNEMKCSRPTTPLRFWHLLSAYLFCFLCVMYKLLTNRGRLFRQAPRPPLAFSQSIHVVCIPMNSLYNSRAFLWLDAFTSIIEFMTGKNSTAANFAY